MDVSTNQQLPAHLSKRNLGPDPVVFDLTFDYDFRRVPRDVGETQMRLDFSNEEGYWDKVVDKAAGTKRKRSLDDVGGNHKRWLEETWREDYHSGLSREELHKRWFGSDLVTWLQGLLNGVQGAPLISHSVSEEFTVVLLDEKYGPCNIKGVNVDAGLRVSAQANVKVDTNFGLTLISTLAFPPDLSNSYLYFRNKGEVTAKFTLDALTTASFDTGDFELAGLENFGATFSVPGILTVGPNFRLFGSVDGSVTLAGRLESQVSLAKWNVRQTFPDANKDYDPTAISDPDRDGTQILGQPTFNYSLSADGHITAHIKPTITFGIDFNKRFLSVDSCKVDLVADGWIRLHASASTENSGSSFCYGVDAGADLYASVEAPKAFGWDLSVPRYPLAQTSPKQIVQTTCPLQTRDLEGTWNPELDNNGIERRSYAFIADNGKPASKDLTKRGQVYGPLFHLNSGLTCPGVSEETASCPICDLSNAGASSIGLLPRDDTSSCMYFAPAPGNIACSGTISERDINLGTFVSNDSQQGHPLGDRGLEKRLNFVPKEVGWKYSGGFARLPCGPYPPCNGGNSAAAIDKWFTFVDDTTSCSSEIVKVDKRKVTNVGDFASKSDSPAPISRQYILLKLVRD